MVRRYNALISSFVICWIILFHYESLRANYLSPLLARDLPKFPLLFPPAGWIMFFQVDASYGFAEVYGIRGNRPVLLDPHEILTTRAVGYDNIHRNALIGVLSPDAVGTPGQCLQLSRTRPRDYQRTALLGVCNDPPERPVESLPFCRFLRRKFPSYDGFLVVHAEYPDAITTPERILRQIGYRCE